MEIVMIIMQVIVGLGILNVWLVRRNLDTPFRGGQAKTMTEEFEHYGLPKWSVPVIGASKVLLALCILAGFFYPMALAIGAAGLGLFMLGAVLMHFKVGDNLIKTLPAFLMLVFCGILALGSNPDIVTLASNL